MTVFGRRTAVAATLPTQNANAGVMAALSLSPKAGPVPVSPSAAAALSPIVPLTIAETIGAASSANLMRSSSDANASEAVGVVQRSPSDHGNEVKAVVLNPQTGAMVAADSAATSSSPVIVVSSSSAMALAGRPSTGAGAGGNAVAAGTAATATAASAAGSTGASAEHADRYSIFNQAQKEVFNLMARDSFTRYLKSPYYKQLVLLAAGTLLI